MNKKELRYFQADAIKAIALALKDKDSRPYINAVTGFGKSVVMADLTDRMLKKGKRVLQLVPNHTLCVQNYEQAISYIGNRSAIGVCSAKLSKYQTGKQAVIATQTSFLRRRTTSGAFDYLLIDECDMVGVNDDNTYQKIIRSLMRLNPDMRIIGMTGSPYRADQGMIHEGVNEGIATFTECCYESDIPKLMEEGYLSTVKILNNHFKVDLEGIRIKGKDFDQAACGVKFDAIIEDAVRDFKALFDENGIKTALIFASTLANGQRIVDEYGNNNECKLAHGDLSTHDRNILVRWLKEGTGKRYLVNVGLYTRGFDFPALEALVLLRATSSLRLYVQIIGRLIRAHEEKDHGFLIDYGSNVERFGAIDNITPPKPPKKGDAPKKLCLVDGCGYPNLLSDKFCKECGAQFISDENKEGLYSMRTKAEILAAKQIDTYEVNSVVYEKAYSKSNGKSMIKMLFYGEDLELIHTHYICVEHNGFSGEQAKRFLMSLFNDVKDFFLLGKMHTTNADNMLLLLNEHPAFFKGVKEVTLKKGDGKYKEIKSMRFYD